MDYCPFCYEDASALRLIADQPWTEPVDRPPSTDDGGAVVGCALNVELSNRWIVESVDCRIVLLSNRRIVGPDLSHSTDQPWTEVRGPWTNKGAAPCFLRSIRHRRVVQRGSALKSSEFVIVELLDSRTVES